MSRIVEKTLSLTKRERKKICFFIWKDVVGVKKEWKIKIKHTRKKRQLCASRGVITGRSFSGVLVWKRKKQTKNITKWVWQNSLNENEKKESEEDMFEFWAFTGEKWDMKESGQVNKWWILE